MQFCSSIRTVVVCCAFSIALPDTTFAEDRLTFTRHSHGWTIEYPATWAIETKDPNYVEVRHPEAEGLCGVHSGKTTITSLDSLVNFMLFEQLPAFRKKADINPQVIEIKQITARPSVAGREVLVNLLPGGRSLRRYFINEGHLTIVDCETHTDRWDRLLSEFEQILSSVSFKVTPAAISFSAGLASLDNGNDDAAFAHLLKSAEGGDARAQYFVGVMFYQGRGVERNQNEAINWLRKAAQQGQLDAQGAFWQIVLGVGQGLYSSSRAEEAFFWMKTAAENGHMLSQFQLAMQFRHGESTLIKGDLEEALKWFIKAALQGDAHSQHEAGAILLGDDDVARDIDAAYGWLSLAVANGRQTATELQQMAASNLSSEEKLALDEKVRRCLDTNYEECEF